MKTAEKDDNERLQAIEFDLKDSGKQSGTDSTDTLVTLQKEHEEQMKEGPKALLGEGGTHKKTKCEN